MPEEGRSVLQRREEASRCHAHAGDLSAYAPATVRRLEPEVRNGRGAHDAASVQVRSWGRQFAVRVRATLQGVEVQGFMVSFSFLRG